MATKVFLLNTTADTHRGTNTPDLQLVSRGWYPKATSTSQGAALTSQNGATAAGPTTGLELQVNPASAAAFEWLTPPVASDVTISGAITGNIWASEDNMSANVAINFVVDKVAAATGAITQIVKSARTTEVAVTTRAVNNFTATPGAGVTLNRGDRLRIRVFADDSTANMGNGFIWTVGWAGATPGADGDTFLSFTETFTFETTDPTGTTMYLTSTGAGINPGAANELEMWTSRGGGSANLVTNTANGWTSGIQITNSGGGTAQEWYSKQLTAFTLGGKALVNIRALESNALANASLRAEIAICDSDGTNPTVWGAACISPIASDFGELDTTDAARTAYVAGDDSAVAEGQRLRLRIYVDDLAGAVNAGDGPLVTGHTVTVSYNGTSGGAAGDTYLTLPQSVTEYVAPVFAHLVMAPHRAP